MSAETVEVGRTTKNTVGSILAVFHSIDVNEIVFLKYNIYFITTCIFHHSRWFCLRAPSSAAVEASAGWGCNSGRLLENALSVRKKISENEVNVKLLDPQ